MKAADRQWLSMGCKPKRVAPRACLASRAGWATEMSLHFFAHFYVLPQESQALHVKQRELQAALAASQKEARAAAGLQERLSSLAAELEASQKEAAAASEQLTLAHSRTAVLEKAYASAVEVSIGGRVLAVVGREKQQQAAPCASAAPQPARLAPCSRDHSGFFCGVPSPVQESHSLQTKQRQLQAALAEAQKEARTAASQSDRLATLQVGALLWQLCACGLHCFAAMHAGPALCSNSCAGDARSLELPISPTPATHALLLLQAELRQAQEAADAAFQQVSLAQSRTAVVEKAYASAVEVGLVGGWLRHRRAAAPQERAARQRRKCIFCNATGGLPLSNTCGHSIRRSSLSSCTLHTAVDRLLVFCTAHLLAGVQGAAVQAEADGSSHGLPAEGGARRRGPAGASRRP